MASNEIRNETAVQVIFDMINAVRDNNDKITLLKLFRDIIDTLHDFFSKNYSNDIYKYDRKSLNHSIIRFFFTGLVYGYPQLLDGRITFTEIYAFKNNIIENFRLLSSPNKVTHLPGGVKNLENNLLNFVSNGENILINGRIIKTNSANDINRGSFRGFLQQIFKYNDIASKNIKLIVDTSKTVLRVPVIDEGITYFLTREGVNDPSPKFKRTKAVRLGFTYDSTELETRVNRNHFGLNGIYSNVELANVDELYKENYTVSVQYTGARDNIINQRTRMNSGSKHANSIAMSIKGINDTINKMKTRIYFNGKVKETTQSGHIYDMDIYLNNPDVFNGIPDGYDFLTNYSEQFSKKRLGDQLQCHVVKKLNRERHRDGDLFIVVTIDRMLFVDCVLNGVPCILDFGTNGFNNDSINYSYWAYYPDSFLPETIRSSISSSSSSSSSSRSSIQPRRPVPGPEPNRFLNRSQGPAENSSSTMSRTEPQEADNTTQQSLNPVYKKGLTELPTYTGVRGRRERREQRLPQYLKEFILTGGQPVTRGGANFGNVEIPNDDNLQDYKEFIINDSLSLIYILILNINYIPTEYSNIRGYVSYLDVPPFLSLPITQYFSDDNNNRNYFIKPDDIDDPTEDQYQIFDGSEIFFNGEYRLCAEITGEDIKLKASDFNNNRNSYYNNIGEINIYTLIGIIRSQNKDSVYMQRYFYREDTANFNNGVIFGGDRNLGKKTLLSELNSNNTNNKQEIQNLRNKAYLFLLMDALAKYENLSIGDDEIYNIHYLNLDTDYILHITEHIELRIFLTLLIEKSQELLERDDISFDFLHYILRNHHFGIYYDLEITLDYYSDNVIVEKGNESPFFFDVLNSDEFIKTINEDGNLYKNTFEVVDKLLTKTQEIMKSDEYSNFMEYVSTNPTHESVVLFREMFNLDFGNYIKLYHDYVEQNNCDKLIDEIQEISRVKRSRIVKKKNKHTGSRPAVTPGSSDVRNGPAKNPVLGFGSIPEILPSSSNGPIKPSFFSKNYAIPLSVHGGRKTRKGKNKKGKKTRRNKKSLKKINKKRKTKKSRKNKVRRHHM